MKLNESWLREWVNPKLPLNLLCHTLTMSGFEVESVTPIEGTKNSLPSKDYCIDLSITPNRGDCLSVKGIAREIAILTKTPLRNMPISVSLQQSKIRYLFISPRKQLVRDM